MSLSKQDKKKDSPKKSTTDSTPIKQSVNPGYPEFKVDPEFRKRCDEMMAGFVNTLNKNTAKKDKPDS